jgi:DNA-binding CsgD family transcriptional regulator
MAAYPVAALTRPAPIVREGKLRCALSAGQAEQLRERAAGGERKSVLAAEFGISRETVYSYLRAAARA